MNDNYWKERYEDLKWSYEKLQYKYEKLEEENTKNRKELDSANYKIRQELEPRIEREKRAYDNWVTNLERS